MSVKFGALAPGIWGPFHQRAHPRFVHPAVSFTSSQSRCHSERSEESAFRLCPFLLVILSEAKNPRIRPVLLKGTASAVPSAFPMRSGFSP